MTTRYPLPLLNPVPEGLHVRPAPALPRGAQIHCDRCGCSVPTSHVPRSEECEDLVLERFFKNRD